MATNLRITRLNLNTKEVTKEERKLPTGTPATEFIAQKVAKDNGDDWRSEDWKTTHNDDGSTKMQSGNIIYIFTSFTSKDHDRRPYHTDHVDRFLAHCFKILKLPESDTPSDDLMQVGSMSKVYEDSLIPFSVVVTNTEENGIEINFKISETEVSMEQATELIIGLRKLISVVRKIQKKKDRLDV